MSRLRVAPIVEGKGELQSVRILLQRVWVELLGGDFVEVLSPIPLPRGQVWRDESLGKRITLACDRLKLPTVSTDPGLVLLLIDADADCPADIGPRLLANGQKLAHDTDFACVVANPEFERWFVASAESLGKYLDLPAGFRVQDEPEGTTSKKKAWVRKHFRGPSYNPAYDQPRLTREMDLKLCLERSASFDKLFRELRRRQRPGPGVVE